jgi:hypothetical protein
MRQRRNSLTASRAAIATIAAAGVAVLLSAVAPAAHAAVNVRIAATTGGSPLCDGPLNGVSTCNPTPLVGNQITITWTLDAATSINGYDFNVAWDPTELTLLSSAQLFPGSQPPNNIPFTIAPNPADPEGSQAVALSLVPFSTTTLLSMTFQRASTIPAECGVHADVEWSANGNGIAPGSVVLLNPGGAGIDFVTPKQCSDGLDNDNDNRIDFDGGVCAGLPPESITVPDPHCTGAGDNREKPNGCGIGVELALALPLLWMARGRRRSG